MGRPIGAAALPSRLGESGFIGERPDAAADDRLGWSILVDEGRLRQQLALPLRQQRRRQLLAADHDDVRGQTSLDRLLHVLKGFEVRRA